jgi:hypothetical protein
MIFAEKKTHKPRSLRAAFSLSLLFQIPLPVQGEGERAWRARVRAVSTQSLTCILVARSARRAHVRRASLSSPQRGSLRKQRHKRDSLARSAFGFASATPHWK